MSLLLRIVPQIYDDRAALRMGGPASISRFLCDPGRLAGVGASGRDERQHIRRGAGERRAANPMRKMLAVVLLISLAACGSSQSSYPEDWGAGTNPNPDMYRSGPGSITGGEGISLTDSLSLRGSSESGGPVLGVNGYLWRATLDTLSFMPLASADPFGGVIITDWFAAPENPNEQMKVTVYILDKRLRADGLKVAVFRQQRTEGGWIDAPVNPDTANRLENAILTRARELRLATLEQ